MSSPITSKSSTEEPPLTASAFQRPTFGTLRGRKITITQPTFFPLPKLEKDLDSFSYNIAARLAGLAGYAIFGLTDTILEGAHTLAGKIKKAAPDTRQLADVLMQAHIKEVRSDTHAVGTAASGIASYIPLIGGFASSAIRVTDQATQVNLTFRQRLAQWTTSALEFGLHGAGAVFQGLTSFSRYLTENPTRYFREVSENPDKLNSDIGSLGDILLSRCHDAWGMIRAKNLLQSCLIPFPLPDNVSLGQLELFLCTSKEEKLQLFENLRQRPQTLHRTNPISLQKWQKAINDFHNKESTDNNKKEARQILSEMIGFYRDLEQGSTLPIIDRLHLTSADELLDDGVLLEEKKAQINGLISRLEGIVTPSSQPLSRQDLETFKREMPNFFLIEEQALRSILNPFLEKAEQLILNHEFDSLMKREDSLAQWKKMFFSVSSSSHWKVSSTEKNELENTIQSLSTESPPLPITAQKLKTLYVMYQMIPENERKSLITPNDFENIPLDKKARLFQFIRNHASDLSVEENKIISTHHSLRSPADWRELSESDQEILTNIICLHLNHMPNEKRQYLETLSSRQIQHLSQPGKIKLFLSLKEEAHKTNKATLEALCSTYLSTDPLTEELFLELPEKTKKHIRKLTHVDDTAENEEIVEKYNALATESKKALLEKAILHIAKKEIDIQTHIILQKHFETTNQLAQIDTSTLEIQLQQYIKQKEEAEEDSPQAMEAEAYIETLESLIAERKLPEYVQEESLQDPHHLPSQKAVDPTSVRPEELEGVSQGALHRAGVGLGIAASKISEFAGDYVTAPLDLIEMPFVDKLFDAGWHSAATLIEHGVGVQTAVEYLSKFAPVRNIETCLESCLEKIISLPHDTLGLLGTWLQDIRKIQQIPGQSAKVQQSAVAMERSIVELQTQWSAICPRGENASQAADALCSERGKTLIQQTQATLRSLRESVMTGTDSATQALIVEAQKKQSSLREIADQGPNWFTSFFVSARKTKAYKATATAVDIAGKELLEAQALVDLKTFQRSKPILSLVANCPLLGFHFFSEATLSRLQTAMTALEHTESASLAMYMGGRWITAAKHRVIQKVEAFTDKSLTDPESEEHTLPEASQPTGWTQTLLRYLVPGALTLATGGSLNLFSTLIQTAMPSLMRKIDPKDIRKLLAGASVTVKKGFKIGGEYSRFFMTSFFDSLQAKVNKYRQYIDPKRLEKLRALPKEGRIYLLELIENSKEVQDVAKTNPEIQRAIASIHEAHNKELFLNPAGFWTAPEWEAFSTDLLLCYALVAQEEKERLTPSLFQSLPKNIQNRIRELVKGEGRDRRNDIPWLVSQFNELTKEEKTVVHTISTNEFRQLGSSTQEDLFAILSTSSLKKHIPGRTSYDRYLYCKSCSRKELATLLALYPRVKTSDFAILTPSQIRSFNYGKLDHVLTILEKYYSGSIAELRDKSRNLSWCESFSTLREKFLEQAKILSQAERENKLPWEVQPNCLLPQELRAREKLLDHISLLFSSLRVTERHDLLKIEPEEMKWMSQKEKFRLASSFLLQMKELQEKLQNPNNREAIKTASENFGQNYTAEIPRVIEFLESCQTPTEELALNLKNRLRDSFNHLKPAFQSKIRIAIEQEEDLLEREAKIMLDDINTIDKLYKACQQDHLRLKLSAGYFLKMSREKKAELSKLQKEHGTPAQIEKVKKEIEKLVRAKEKRVRELQTLEGALQEIEKKRTRKARIMELAGQKPPSFTSAVEIGKEYEETVRIFVTETKKAIAHDTSETLKKFLNSKKTLREQVEYAKGRLQENSEEIEITTVEKTRLLEEVPELFDITEADRSLLSYFTDKVLCQAQNNAKETFMLTRKEFIEGCRHTFAASALREKISFEDFSANFMKTIGSSMTDEEKQSCLEFVSDTLLRQKLTLLAQDLPSKTTFDLSDDLLRATTELEIEDFKKVTLGALETEIHNIEEQEKKLPLFSSMPKEQKSLAGLLLTTKNNLLSEQTRIQSIIQKRKAEILPKGVLGWLGRFFQNFWYRIRYQAARNLSFSQKYVLKNRF